MARFRSRFEKQAERKKYRAMLTTAAILVAAIAGGWWYVSERSQRLSLDDRLCPPEPETYSVLLVDVTDPMNLPQRQDLLNKLEELKGSVPRYGKISIFKVDATSARLLSPVIEICNPGKASDVSEMTGDPKAMQKRWQEKFEAPLDAAFESLTQASGGDQSPILQSIQSVTLTQLRKAEAVEKPRRLIVVSDLLQNTPGLSFYGRLPSAEEVLASPEFNTARTELRGVDVELWMLQRPDFSTTQPRALIELWEVLIGEQHGNLETAYRVSG